MLPARTAASALARVAAFVSAWSSSACKSFIVHSISPLWVAPAPIAISRISATRSGGVFTVHSWNSLNLRALESKLVSRCDSLRIDVSGMPACLSAVTISFEIFAPTA